MNENVSSQFTKNTSLTKAAKVKKNQTEGKCQKKLCDQNAERQVQLYN